MQQGLLTSSLLKKKKKNQSSFLIRRNFSVQSAKELWPKLCVGDYCVRSCHCGDSRFVVNRGSAGHANETRSSFNSIRTPADGTTGLLSRFGTHGGTRRVFVYLPCSAFPRTGESTRRFHLSHIHVLPSSLMRSNQEVKSSNEKIWVILQDIRFNKSPYAV